MLENLSTNQFAQIAFGLLALLAVISLLLVVAHLSQRLKGQGARQWIAVAVFAGPAVLLLMGGLVYPAIRTIWMSFLDRRGEKFVGAENYAEVLTQPAMLQTLLNTAAWVVLVPLLATGIGLLYAILIDGAKLEKLAKSLMFMPMAISFVGAGIIWTLMYDYKGAAFKQTGLANAVVKLLGGEPVRFIQDTPMNTFYLIIVMIWIQAGFAMVLLSAAIKAIPEDIVEAARLDGVNAWQMFRRITVPSIRPTLVVVLTTIIIATLKVFDIVKTMTGGNFRTSVLANEMYNQSFVHGNNGLGSALAVMIFVLVIPVVAYNIHQMLVNREVRGA